MDKPNPVVLPQLLLTPVLKPLFIDGVPQLLNMRAYTLPFLGQRAHLPAVAGRRACVVVRSNSDVGLGGGMGVQDLLARDRKQPKLAPELARELGEVPVEKVLEDFESEVKVPQVKSRRQRRDALVASSDQAGSAAAAAIAQDPNRPKRCKDAIDAGLILFKERKYQDAVAMFNVALELPGNGAYRLGGSPREYSCPSDAEEVAALYNMACAYSQLGEKAAAITCLEAVLENGFEDYATIRSDPDLAPLRGRDLDGLLGKYDNPVAKLKKILPGGGNKQAEGGGGLNKPWLLW